MKKNIIILLTLLTTLLVGCTNQQPKVDFTKEQPVVDAISKITIKHDVDDITIREIDRKYSNIDIYGFSLVSTKFNELNDDEKLELLADCRMCFYDKTDLIPSDCDYKGCQIEVSFFCNGTNYEIWNNDSTYYQLMVRKDGSQYCEEIKSKYIKPNETDYVASDSPTDNNNDSTTTKVKCSFCNGTGSIKYYYGDSALQAALDGYDDYEFGPCTSCDGTGYTYVKEAPGTDKSSGELCSSCKKRVDKLITNKDAAGVNRTWCADCWSDYNYLMGN